MVFQSEREPGNPFYQIYLLDLETGELLADKIDDTTSNFEWANDSQTILYGKQHPETLRSYQVFRHTLGEPGDTLVYQEDDETNYLYVSKSLSSAFFYLTSVQTLSTEVRYVAADSPEDTPTLFLAREEDHEYCTPTHRGLRRIRPRGHRSPGGGAPRPPPHPVPGGRLPGGDAQSGAGARALRR